jgi:hypothetical protein
LCAELKKSKIYHVPFFHKTIFSFQGLFIYIHTYWTINTTLKTGFIQCERDSRAKSQPWTQKQWLSRVALKPGVKNVVRDSLIDPKKVLLPPLHIKLGLMKQFVKALPKERECFKYLCKKFPGLSDAKLK